MVLQNSRRRTVRAILHVSGDGLRVVEDETKGLIVDQTIEKVSFCAPDRNHEKGFSYICRDGTTRRWMCHGFLATKESVSRMSSFPGLQKLLLSIKQGGAKVSGLIPKSRSAKLPKQANSISIYTYIDILFACTVVWHFGTSVSTQVSGGSSTEITSVLGVLVESCRFL